MSNYEKEFQIFASNINQAARAFYYHSEIQQQVYEDGVKHQALPEGDFQDSKIFQAINANAQFWNDYKYSSLLYTIVTLGRIFDENKKSHGIKRLIRIAKKSGIFTKTELRKRKISGSETAHEWIDAYMSNVSEISPDQYYQFLRYTVATRKLWKNVKDVRNKLYAHQDVLSTQKESEILEKATYVVFEQIISRLLTIEEILFEAFYNGKNPDFEYVNTKIHEKVKADVRSLLARLVATIHKDADKSGYRE